MTLELPTYGTIKVLVVKKDDITAMVEYNDVKHFYLQKNRDSKTVTIELQDIFAPSAVKASLTLDSGVDRFAKLLTIETIWDTLNKDTTTEIFTIGFQRNGPAYAYNSQFTWSNKDVDSLTGNFEQVQGKLLTAVSVLHNDEKRFGFDMAMVSEISSGVSVCIVLLVVYSGPENFKKVQAKKFVKSNKSFSRKNFFWPNSIFGHFKIWPKINF